MNIEDNKTDNLIRYIASRLMCGMTNEQIVNDLKIACSIEELYLAITAAKILNKYR